MKAPFSAVRTTWLAVMAIALPSSALAQAPDTPLAEDVHEKMRQLIVQIERGLSSVDRLLWNADARPGRGETPDLGARLGAARERSRKVVEDIDLLLEIRHHPHDGGGGGS